MGAHPHGADAAGKVELAQILARHGAAYCAAHRLAPVQYRALRAIEAVSPDDLPAGSFPDLSGPWSSVVMTERGTLRHMAGEAAREPWVESIELHEGCGDCLMAAGYVLPDLRLEVEGGCRSALLDRWATVVGELAK